MIPEIYVLDDDTLSDGALLAAWREACETGRRVAIGLSPERLARSSTAAWEAGRGAVCVVGGPEGLDGNLDDTDGLHLLDATPSRVRAARRTLGPERLLMAPGPPRADEVWEDVDGVDAWLVSAIEADGSFPAIVWVRGADEAAGVGGSARGFAVRASRLRDADTRWFIDFCEGVFHG